MKVRENLEAEESQSFVFLSLFHRLANERSIPLLFECFQTLDEQKRKQIKCAFSFYQHWGEDLMFNLLNAPLCLNPCHQLGVSFSL